MKKIVIDGFELTKDYQDRLLADLKEEGVKTPENLEHYFRDYWYTKDNAMKSHLLLCKHGKKRNFALPFDD